MGQLCFPLYPGHRVHPPHTGRWLTVLVGVFMVVNMAVSRVGWAGLIRSDARSEGEPPANALDVFLDDHFPDERMARIYPTQKKRKRTGRAGGHETQGGDAMLTAVYYCVGLLCLVKGGDCSWMGRWGSPAVPSARPADRGTVVSVGTTCPR